MPPTDFFDSSDSRRSSIPSCDSEPQMQPLPNTRSPLHHGTDPDLSAPTPLPAGVALTGLDLSPMTVGSGSLAVAKRKHRCHMVAMSPQPSRLSRGLPSARKAEFIAKRAVTQEQSSGHALQHQPSRSARPASSSHPVRSSSARGGTDDKMAASTQPRSPPAENDDRDQPAACGQPRAHAMIDSSGDGNDSQPSELPRLKSSSYSARRGENLHVRVPPRVSEDERSVEEGLKEPHAPEKTSLEVIMAKARVASDNIRLLLHAKRCDGLCCKEPGCASARQLVEHMRFCGGSSGGTCENSKCHQAHKILLHYAECSHSNNGNRLNRNRGIA